MFLAHLFFIPYFGVIDTIIGMISFFQAKSLTYVVLDCIHRMKLSKSAQRYIRRLWPEGRRSFIPCGYIYG